MNFKTRNRLILAVTIVAIAILSFSLGRSSSSDEHNKLPAIEVSGEINECQDDPTDEPLEEASQPEPLVKMITIGRGDSIYNILTANGIASQQAYKIIKAAKQTFDLARILPGHELSLVYSPDGQILEQIIYEISYLDSLIVSLNGEEISSTKKQIERVLSSSYAGKFQTVKTTVNKGDNVYEILSKMGIDDYQSDLIYRASKKVFNLSGIAPGHQLSALITVEKPIRASKITYEIDGLTFLEITAENGNFVAAKKTLDVEIRHERAEGVINSSLYQSGIEAGLAPSIVMELTDIFAWDINFFTDIQPGDRYTLVYEKFFVEDKFKGYGRILAAQFINQGEDHTAIYYNNGKGTRGYYGADGKPIQKLFLKAPLNYRRISSRFTYNRVHPVYKTSKPHLGVDYAAPQGTPVVALGDGQVIHKGWNGGFGECVKIKHQAGYVSYYGHLSGYARGVRNGSRVEQGQVIAYVGSTGVSTGPHLDFRVKHNGKFVNPLRLKAVAGDPLRGEDLVSFKELASKRLAMLDDRSLNIASLSINNG